MNSKLGYIYELRHNDVATTSLTKTLTLKNNKMGKDINKIELQRSDNLTNCAAGKPLITFGGGDAPVLNYRMPQSTSFTTYGNIIIGVDAECWSDRAKQIYSNEQNGKPVFEVANTIVKETSNVFTSKGILNSRLIESFNSLSASEYKIEAEKISAIKSMAKSTSNATIDETMLLKRANFLAEKITSNYVPISIKRFNGKENRLEFVKRPNETNPTLFIIEEYKTISFLGNYGAGKTINTFTLLPGEKTTIFIKTFKEISETKVSSSNIVDSFSKESADEMEDLMEAENATSDSSSSADSLTETSSKSRTAEAHFDVKASFKIAGQGGSASAGGSVSGTNTSGTTNTVSNTSARTANAKNLHKALNKHVDKSNSNRTNSISQNDTSSSKETFENSITREIVNPNVSRVLNFVFRDLLQEYITITVLNDIKIGFTNGHPESERLVAIEHLEVLLAEVIKNDKEVELCKQNIRNHLQCQYGTVADYSGEERLFLELHKEDVKKPCSKGVQYFRKVPKLKYFYNTVSDETLTKAEAIKKEFEGILKFDVNGVILNVDKFILKSDSVIIDSLLGQASALDCFNANVQEEKKNELVLNNLKQELAFETLKQIADPIKRAEMYAEMFNPRQNIINS